MNEHKDEILLPVLDSDATAVPRYNIIGPDGKTLYKNVSLKLMNGIAQEGTPINKPLLDEFLAAAGITAGTATAYTLAQKGYSLFDGAEVRFRLHKASGSGATLNVNGTGAKPLRDAMGESMASGMPAGTWLKAIYSAATGAYTISGGATNVTPAAIGAVQNIATYYTTTTAKSADDLTDSFALIPVSADLNPDLFNIVKGSNAYVHTSFYISAEVTSRRMQIAVSYNSTNPKMAMRIYSSSGWLPWREIADTNYAVNKAGDTMTGALKLVAGSTIGGNAILHTGNIGNYLPADTGNAKVLTDVRLTSNTASVAITLPTDYNYFRIVISGITVTTGATVKVDCNAATRRHEGMWLFDIMENNEPGIAGIATERYSRLIDVAVPDAKSMASITMDAHRTPSGMQGQAIAVASDGDGAGTGEINIGTWYADQNNLTEITVSVSSGYMRAGTGIMVVGVK